MLKELGWMQPKMLLRGTRLREKKTLAKGAEQGFRSNSLKIKKKYCERSNY
jgi:hypothetical protein